MMSLCDIIQSHAKHFCTYLLTNTPGDKQKWMWMPQIRNTQEGIINFQENVQEFMLAINRWWRSLSARTTSFLSSHNWTSNWWISTDSTYYIFKIFILKKMTMNSIIEVLDIENTYVQELMHILKTKLKETPKQTMM